MATKTFTFAGPADHTRVDSITLQYDANTNKVIAVISARPFDAGSGTYAPAVSTTVPISLPNANLTAVYTAAINAWNTANGY